MQPDCCWGHAHGLLGPYDEVNSGSQKRVSQSVTLVSLVVNSVLCVDASAQTLKPGKVKRSSTKGERDQGGAERRVQTHAEAFYSDA